VKILDFGIAKLWRSIDSNVPDGSTDLTLPGSPHYMAPEQMTKGAILDVRCDIWSLGVVLYELLVFHRPFDGPSPIEVCINVINESFVPLSKRRRGVSPVLERIIERCLAKDPAARYGSVTELADALRAFRSDTRACR
jgi:serine/threonine-protein kinase